MTIVEKWMKNLIDCYSYGKLIGKLSESVINWLIANYSFYIIMNYFVASVIYLKMKNRFFSLDVMNIYLFTKKYTFGSLIYHTGNFIKWN